MGKIKFVKFSHRKGAGTMLLGLTVMMLALVFMILLVEQSRVSYAQTIAQTRGDAIADSVAVYAQAWQIDYSYNQEQARSMLDTITELNDPSHGDNVNGFDIQTAISFPADDILTVSCTAKVLSAYPNITNSSSYTFLKESSVKSKNIYEDVVIVPGYEEDPPTE